MDPREIGQVLAVTIRTAHGVSGVDSAHLTSGTGLDDDVHADPLSPRQLLLASAGTYDMFSLLPHALRENLLVDADTLELASGTVLQVGDEVQLRLMFQCEACGQLDRQQPGLARKLGLRRGMLARVLAGGVIRRGDRIRDIGMLETPWPEDWRERIAQVLDAVPPQHVVEYRQLARLAGVQTSYCRAFPGMIAKLGDRFAGKAIPAKSSSALPRWDGQALFQDTRVR